MTRLRKFSAKYIKKVEIKLGKLERKNVVRKWREKIKWKSGSGEGNCREVRMRKLRKKLKKKFEWKIETRKQREKIYHSKWWEKVHNIIIWVVWEKERERWDEIRRK